MVFSKPLCRVDDSKKNSEWSLAICSALEAKDLGHSGGIPTSIDPLTYDL